MRYAIFTDRQQAAYDALEAKARVYVDYRGRGMSKPQAYVAAGYSPKTAAQGCHVLEKRNPIIAELTEVLSTGRQLKDMSPNSELSQKIDGLTEEAAKNKAAMSFLENADEETLKTVKFYRDVINGTIKTVKIVKTYDADDNLTGKRVEETSNVETRIQARKILDEILGLRKIADVRALQVGDITVNIVDTSRQTVKPKKPDGLDLSKLSEIDGEEVLVVEEKEEHSNGERESKS